MAIFTEVMLAWRALGNRYHAAGLGAAIKRTTLGDIAPATVFESLFRHYDGLLRRGCSSAEIHALVIQSFHPWEQHHLHYIRRFEKATGGVAAEVIDATTLSNYINAMRRLTEHRYPHICGRDRRHPMPKMLSVPRI